MRPCPRHRGPAALEPPQPLVPTTVPYPVDAPAHDAPIVVRIKISVAADGTVHKVELLSHSLPVFDDAVVKAAQAFTFQPARYGGQPVPVEITFTQPFNRPAAARAHRRCWSSADLGVAWSVGRDGDPPAPWPAPPWPR